MLIFKVSNIAYFENQHSSIFFSSFDTGPCLYIYIFFYQIQFQYSTRVGNSSEGRIHFPFSFVISFQAVGNHDSPQLHIAFSVLPLLCFLRSFFCQLAVNPLLSLPSMSSEHRCIRRPRTTRLEVGCPQKTTCTYAPFHPYACAGVLNSPSLLSSLGLSEIPNVQTRHIPQCHQGIFICSPYQARCDTRSF